MIQNQIWRHNMHIIFCIVQNIHIDKLAHILMIQRTVTVRNHIAFPFRHAITIRCIQIFFIILLRFIYVPYFQKHQSKVSYRLSLNHNRSIFPGSKPFQFSDIFVCKINTTGKSCLSINHYNFSVVTVILHRR